MDTGPDDMIDAAGEAVSLAALLAAALEALAKAGQAEAACRAAGRACALLREADPPQWLRFNALLHRLSREAESVGLKGKLMGNSHEP